MLDDGFEACPGRLIRELDLHSIELELQQEELTRRHAELAAARDRSAELGRAPAGK